MSVSAPFSLIPCVTVTIPRPIRSTCGWWNDVRTASSYAEPGGSGLRRPYANELLCLTAPRPDLKPEEVVFFATPVNAEGIHLVCRQPLTPPNPEDHSLSPNWDEMDAIVVFDDVFIPWERVFYLRSAQPADPTFEAQVFQGAVGLGPWYVLVRMAVKAEVLLGLCAAITDALGTASQPLVQMAMADAMVYLETLRALIQAAESQPS